MSELPTGIVTFLFTDIEGSTGLLQTLGDGYRALQDRHGEIIETAVAAEGGHVVRIEGDAFFVTFRNPSQAVRAVVAAQRDLEVDWSSPSPLRVRMGLHTGHGVLGGGDYIGIDVNRAARIAAAASGGQILVSDATRAMVQYDLPDGVALRDLGQHRLKDIAHPEHLFDVVIDGLRTDFPPIRSLDARPNNLPLQLTSFVGRADEIAQAMQLLADHRLVTLTGPGGSGKTRLAIEVAAEVLRRFEDGVFFVDLAPVSDPTQVSSAITQALAIREQPGRELIDTLVDRLAAKGLLLVLDNFEHVLPAASVADRLLMAARRLRILATSRAPLRIYGEQEQHVLPLALPDPKHPPTLEAVTRYEAVTLFRERAHAARAGFALTDESAPAVAGICARLDGLPLAIELAASRVKVLTPQAILSRLDAGPDLLTASARNVPARQRTLRATIGWSASLLAEPEQRLFTRLSVFRGGADLEAVEAVGNPDGDLGIDTLDALTSLIDNSLVRHIEMSTGEPRYAMLETIREYARELLIAQEELASAERRHAEFFMALAREGESHLTSVDQRRWLDRFEREHDNFLAAFQWTIEAGEPESGMAAAAAMWRFWQQRGFLSVGRSWLERLLAAGQHQSAVVAKTHLAAGGIAHWQAEYEAAGRHYQEALEISQALGDRHGIAEATYNVAFAVGPDIVNGKPDWASGQKSLQLLRNALTQFEELGDAAGAAKAKGNLALFLGGLGEIESAKPLLEEAITSYRRLGDMFHLSDALLAYGQGLQMLGQFEGAAAPILEALGLFDQADNVAGVSLALETLSALESARARHERAMRLLGASQEIRRTIEGGYPMQASSFVGIAPEADARTSIADAEVDRALAEGRSMTRIQAVEYAKELG